MSADILSFIYYDWKVRHAIVQKKTKLVESDKSNHIFFDTTNAHVCNRVKQEDFKPIAKKNSCNLEYL